MTELEWGLEREWDLELARDLELEWDLEREWEPGRKGEPGREPEKTRARAQPHVGIAAGAAAVPGSDRSSGLVGNSGRGRGEAPDRETGWQRILDLVREPVLLCGEQAIFAVPYRRKPTGYCSRDCLYPVLSSPGHHHREHDRGRCDPEPGSACDPEPGSACDPEPGSAYDPEPGSACDPELDRVLDRKPARNSYAERSRRSRQLLLLRGLPGGLLRVRLPLPAKRDWSDSRSRRRVRRPEQSLAGSEWDCRKNHSPSQPAAEAVPVGSVRFAPAALRPYENPARPAADLSQEPAVPDRCILVDPTGSSRLDWRMHPDSFA